MKFELYGLGIAKGMALTFKHLFRSPITVQYPEEKLNTSKRIRGNELVWFPEKCTGCGTCTKACPQGNIQLVTHKSEDNKFNVDKFEIDTGRCIFCGLCVESCPYNALAMGLSYECSKYRRGDMVLDKEKLSVAENHKPSAYFRPQFDRQLPAQSLLLYDRKEGGQKLKFLPLSTRKRGSGA
ncbi:MAG: NADH-quinone oxidoreductase subunit I [Dehalococcoidia bacterium]|nr:NADH-quinone oxidoreductase subunit I [Dehalococcoidia bacterium]